VYDRLAEQIQEGVRYQASLRLKEQIRAGIVAKRAATKDNNEATKAVKRAKVTYIVDGDKFDSKVSEQQLALDLTEDDLGTEETHQILQHKIQYVNFRVTDPDMYSDPHINRHPGSRSGSALVVRIPDPDPPAIK